jgi:hypothetical protein
LISNGDTLKRLFYLGINCSASYRLISNKYQASVLQDPRVKIALDAGNIDDWIQSLPHFDGFRSILFTPKQYFEKFERILTAHKVSVQDKWRKYLPLSRPGSEAKVATWYNYSIAFNPHATYHQFSSAFCSHFDLDLVIQMALNYRKLNFLRLKDITVDTDDFLDYFDRLTEQMGLVDDQLRHELLLAALVGKNVGRQVIRYLERQDNDTSTNIDTLKSAIRWARDSARREACFLRNYTNVPGSRGLKRTVEGSPILSHPVSSIRKVATVP